MSTQIELWDKGQTERQALGSRLEKTVAMLGKKSDRGMTSRRPCSAEVLSDSMSLMSELNETENKYPNYEGFRDGLLLVT